MHTDVTCYTCHICNTTFESPNPLKLHLVLNCNQLDKSYIWTLLANRVTAFNNCSSRSYQYSQTAFTFTLTSSTTTLPLNVVPPILTTCAGISVRKDSSNWSNQLSPLSLTQLSSSSSSSQISPLSNQPSPLSLTRSSLENIVPTEDLPSHRSAFKPYVHRENVCRNLMTLFDQIQPSTIPLNNTEIAAKVETIVSHIGKSKNGHRCIYCKKVYTRKYGLKIHIRTHTGYRPLKCPFCQRAFGDPSNLNKHVRLHANGNTPYKCDVCGKVLVRRRDLERHMRSRHQQDVDQISEESSNEIDVSLSLKVSSPSNDD